MSALSSTLLVSTLLLLVNNCSGQRSDSAQFIGGNFMFNKSINQVLQEPLWKFLNFYTEAINVGDVSLVLASLINNTLNELTGNINADALKCNSALASIFFTERQFLDAWGKLPPGVLFGDFNWVGSYQQCIRLKAPANVSSSQEPFGGQYCSSVVYPSSQKNNSDLLAAISGGSAPLPFPIPSITVGFCFPDTCSASMLTYILNTTLQKLPTAPVQASVFCQPIKKRKITTSAACVIALISVIGAFIVAGTVYDVVFYRQQVKKAIIDLRERTQVSGNDGANDMVMLTAEELALALHGGFKVDATKTVENELSMMCRILMCFSLLKNCQRLFTVKQPDGNNRPMLGAVHGIRFLSMSWVILGHTFFYEAILGMKNIVIAFDLIQRFTFQVLLSATVSVDSFFVISGLLITFLALREIESKGGIRKFNWVMFYMHRYWRLTIPYMIILGIHAALFEYMGSGPLWPLTGIEPHCKKNWWTNLFYVNNLVNVKEKCYGLSWFLALDMQFFWITPIFLILLFWKWWLGVAVSLVTLFASLITTGVLSAHYKFQASTQGQVAKPEQVEEGDYFDILYATPWCRSGPYLLGVLCGYLLYKTNLKVRMHWALVVLGWSIATTINMLVVFGLYKYTKKDIELSVATEAFYNAVHRSAWGLGMCWLIFACVTGYGGFVNKLLSWKALVPLSRLTYMAYFVHQTVMFSYMLQRKYLFNYDDYSIIYDFLASLVMSYSAAFVACMMFEAPFMDLEKVLIGYVRQRKKTSKKNNKDQSK